MALANKKSEELYNRKIGASADNKTIDATKETILQNAFNDKEYINDDTNLLFNAGLVYIVQQMQEDIEELRRFVSNDIDTLTTAQSNAITANTAKVGITSSQSNAITANSAKVGITTAQANAITANTSKVSQGLNTTNMTMQFDVLNKKGTYTLVITIIDSSGGGKPVIKTGQINLV
tara:strand:- start:255 stop:785 length:531 start_codon:yes stop_codon:yes gene_type:complete